MPSSRGCAAAASSVALAELAREAAFGIIRAADEGAEAAQLQAQFALAAARADARAGAVRVRREDVRTQDFVQLVDDLRDLQVLGAADRGGEVAPEIAQQLLPGQGAGRHFVELLFEVGGETVFDIAREEGRQERRHQPALVVGHEAAAVHAHIGAVAQRRQDRGIGRGPADAELFQLAHQAGFGIARRRLGEMLRRLDLLDLAACRRYFGQAGFGRPRRSRRPCLPDRA